MRAGQFQASVARSAAPVRQKMNKLRTGGKPAGFVLPASCGPIALKGSLAGWLSPPQDALRVIPFRAASLSVGWSLVQFLTSCGRRARLCMSRAFASPSRTVLIPLRTGTAVCLLQLPPTDSSAGGNLRFWRSRPWLCAWHPCRRCRSSWRRSGLTRVPLPILHCPEPPLRVPVRR